MGRNSKVRLAFPFIKMMEAQVTQKFELLARWGYAARGVVYVILGLIALMGSSSGDEASPQGALSNLLSQPFGRVLLAGVALGLVGHVLWRMAQAILNADNQDENAKGYVVRLGNLASGLVNAALTLAAARLVFAAGGSGSDGQESMAAWLMQQPFGRFLVGALGLSIIVAGALQIWRGLGGKYRDRVKLPQNHERLLHWICAFGLAARGAVLAITGGFLVFAAVTVDSHQAGSVPEALDWVRQLPAGSYLYALAAAGLAAFGLYSVIEARYRHIDAPDGSELKDGAAKLRATAEHLR
jgi:hypothetical protein